MPNTPSGTRMRPTWMPSALREAGDLADRIGHRGDLFAALRNGLDDLVGEPSRSTSGAARPAFVAASMSSAFVRRSASDPARRRCASASSAAFFAAVGAAAMRAAAARAAAPMWAIIAGRSVGLMPGLSQTGRGPAAGARAASLIDPVGGAQPDALRVRRPARRIALPLHAAVQREIALRRARAARPAGLPDRQGGGAVARCGARHPLGGCVTRGDARRLGRRRGTWRALRQRRRQRRRGSRRDVGHGRRERGGRGCGRRVDRRCGRLGAGPGRRGQDRGGGHSRGQPQPGSASVPARRPCARQDARRPDSATGPARSPAHAPRRR